MSEHNWSQEQIAAYVAGGLAAEEKDRFEAHLRECPECAAELNRNRAIDRGLESLFASVRPSGSLEDRTVYSLHVIKASRLLQSRWKRNLLIGVAASVGLGLAGASVSAVAGNGELMLPGQGRLNFDLPSFASVGNAVRSANRSWKEDRSEALGDAPDSDIQFGAYTGWHDGRSLDPNFLSDQAPAAPGALPAEGMVDQSRSDEAIKGRFTGGQGDFDQPRKPTAAKAPNAGDDEKHDLGYYPPSLALGGQAKPRYRPYVRDPNAPTSGDAGAMGLNAPGKPAPGTDSNGNLYGYDGLQRKLGDQLATSPSTPSQAAGEYRGFSPSAHKPAVSSGDNKSFKSELVTGEFRSGSDLEKRAYKNTNGDDLKPEEAKKVVGLVEMTADAPPAPPAAQQKIIIRTGEVEFEVESFDNSVASVISLVAAIKGGFVATVNSDKLANGKVKGSIVVRVPPEALDKLVLDLRKLGELKGQRIGSQDITKQFTDTESRLKAARTMETRLLQIIKDGKGEIKQLLEAEKELGVWRTKIEEMEGELRYYQNQVSLSTLTITLAEKEIRSAAGITESERVQAGLEVEDVEKAQQALLAAVTEAKGRITKSEMKQLGSGQFNATVDFEVAPERAGAVRDRLRQLGHEARLEIDRVQKAEGGTPQKDSKVTRGDTQFFVQLYNVARMAARESTTLQLAAPDVAAAYQSLKNAVTQAKGRILRANLDEQDRQNVSGVLDFEVRRADEAGVLTAIDAAGDVLSRVVSRSDEGESVTDAKVHIQAMLYSSAHIPPRSTYSIGVEVADVEQAISVLSAQVGNAKGRVVDSNVSHQRNGQATGKFVCTVPLATAASLAEQFKSIGTVHTQQVANDLRAPDGKLALARIDVTLANGDVMVAKDTGLWPQIHKGLVYSANFLLVSLTWVIFGLCAVLPWAIVGYVGYRLIRWMSKKPA